RVMAGVSRTDRLTWRCVAVLAQDGAELDAHVGELALPISLHADPMHGPAARRLHIADGRNVVFRAARRDARLAARASIEIHCHAPSMCHVSNPESRIPNPESRIPSLFPSPQ